MFWRLERTSGGGVALLALGLSRIVGIVAAPTLALAYQSETCGDFVITVAEGDSAEYSYANGVLTITGGTLTVSNTDPSTPTNERIVISGHVDVTLAGVNIERSTSGSPVEVDDYARTDVTIRLQNENSLVSSAAGTPALRKSRGQTGGNDVSMLTITSADGDGSASGSLTARSTGEHSAGIGAGEDYHGDVANITIAGGTVDVSATSGASVGSTGGGSTWGLVISGGVVTAAGGDGLGANTPNGVSNFEITGGYVVTSSYRGSTPTGGLVSTDGGKSFTAWGDCRLPESQSPLSAERLTIEQGATLTIPESACMTVSKTVINNGTLAGEGALESTGTFYNNGTIANGVVEGDVTEQLVTIEGGTANGSADPQTVSAGSTVALHANEVVGMVFTGWEVTMGHGVELVDPAAAETTFLMPSGSCVTIRATYEYLFGTIVTETGEEISVTGERLSDSYALLRDSGWQNYPNSTFRLTAPDEIAEGLSNYLSLPNELPAGAAVDLNGRTMTCDVFALYHDSAASQLCVRNGTLTATHELGAQNLQLTLEDVTLSDAGSWDGSLNINVYGSASSLTFGEGTSLSDNTTSVTIGGYRGSVTIPCALAQDERLSFEGEINVNRVHSWTATTGGAATCTSCGLRRGSAELSLSSAEGLVYDGESLTAADAGVTATRDGADCSGEVVFCWQRVNSDGSLGRLESGLPRDAGTYRVTATLYGSSTDDVAYETLAETVTVNVAARPVTVRFDGSVTAQEKVYDGTLTAELSDISSGAAFQLDGVLDRDQGWVWLSLDGVHGEFADAGVGTEKSVAVLLDNPSLSSSNYALSSNEVQLESGVTASITPRPVELEWQGVTGRFFGDGRDVTALVKGAVEGDDVFAQVNNGGQHEAGTYTATAALAGSDAANYILAEGALQSVAYTVAPAVVTPDGTQASSLDDAGVAQTSFVFGEKIVVRVVPALASSEQGVLARGLAEPAPEQMALYYGDTQISDPVSAASDGSYTMTYDTSEGIVPAGAEFETLVARLVGSENVSGFEVAVEVTVAKAPQAAPEGVAPTNELTVGDGGQLSGLPAGGEWRPAGEGAWRPVPAGGVVSGLPAGDYEVRLPESETHAASESARVTIKDFSSTHGGITYPAGTTDSGDGLATLPDGGGMVTFPNGATVVLPGGSTVDPEAQVAATPSGVEVTPDGDGLSVRLPGGAVVSAGSATVGQDGSVALPNGGTITYQDGTTGQIGHGETVAPDVKAPERGPQQGAGSSDEPTSGSEGEPEPEPTPAEEGLADTGDASAFVPVLASIATGASALGAAVALRRRSK